MEKEESHTLVSFDTVSLFTNIPASETLPIVRKVLVEVCNSDERSSIWVDKVMKL
jgi:hypothetical protein